MVKIRSTNDLILGQIDFFRTAQPNLDIKPGTIARDLVIDAPSTQVARVYEELSSISNLQSIRFLNGSDLEKFAQNFGLVKERGSKATGPALFTFSALEADIALNSGDIVLAKNGASFEIINSFTISPVLEGTFRATAAKYRSELDFVGITDSYAVEVLVRATSSGVSGNISKYSLNRTSIPSINNVTNVFPFSGGRDVENDGSFRNKIIGKFNGANTGTPTGYRSAVIADPSVIDAVVIEPGDPLMTRDGTQVSIAEDGTRTVIADGSGGKVDIYVLGTRIQEVFDTYIFRELSNTGDTTNSDNDKVLGQISGDENKTVTRKRLDNLETGVLPFQPVRNIIQVTGSSSGSNFVEKQVDSLGRVTGNYELIKDDGAFGGSPWGFDKLHWISNQITGFEENKTKGSFNGQDALSYTDVKKITGVRQSIVVTNENSKVLSSDRSLIQLSHSQVTNVTRVFNVTTGERYVVANQNPDGSGNINTTGRIKISGQNLPATSDILQVDYTWVLDYDPYFDFDNKFHSTNLRSPGDTVDWGYSNLVRRERVTLISSGSYLTATVTHPVSTVISANVFVEETSNLILSSSRLAIAVSASVENVVSVVRTSDNVELWDTSESDGSFSGQTIYLPTDTLGEFGQEITVVYNTTDVFNATTQGNFSDNVITIAPSADAVAGELVEISYIANISNILPTTTISDLPAIRSANKFDTNSLSDIGNQPTTHVFDGSGSVIISNLRQAPSVLGVSIVGSISPGTLTISGTTLTGYFDVVFTASTNGLKQNLSSAIKSVLGLSSNQTVSSTIKLAKLAKLEKVTTSGSEVITSDYEFDLLGYRILDNNFSKAESSQDSSLTNTEVEIPATSNNETEGISVGDRLRARFYLANYNDSENLYFSRSGLLYTDKTFALVDTIAVSSGFSSASSASATITVTNLNQPITRSRYLAFYDYTAPKVNERINIRYNYDKLITDATLTVEEIRPIGADVLLKRSIPILIDVTMKIVVKSDYINKSEVVIENVRDAISSELSPRSLATIVDASDLIDVAYSIDGLDRARITYFNKTGETGSLLSIESQKNEYLQANNIVVEVESR